MCPFRGETTPDNIYSNENYCCCIGEAPDVTYDVGVRVVVFDVYLESSAEWEEAVELYGQPTGKLVGSLGLKQGIVDGEVARPIAYHRMRAANHDEASEKWDGWIKAAQVETKL